jgi:hypothetical protein
MGKLLVRLVPLLWLNLFNLVDSMLLQVVGLPNFSYMHFMAQVKYNQDF